MKLDHKLENICNVQIFVVEPLPPLAHPNIVVNLSVATTNTI
jgi:hypothetical protein